ncbi:MAG: hypothetical protein ABI426_07605 [Flavobacterium sp.]
MKISPIKLALFCLVVCTSFGQTQKEIYKQSIQAYQNKNYPQFLQLTQELDNIRPSHPTYTFNLACAYALNGKTNEALSVLEKCILMNNTVVFETENDLASLKSAAGYSNLLE